MRRHSLPASTVDMATLLPISSHHRRDFPDWSTVLIFEARFFEGLQQTLNVLMEVVGTATPDLAQEDK